MSSATTSSQDNIMNNIAEKIRTDPSMRQSFIDLASQQDPALGQQLTQNLRLLDTVARTPGPQGLTPEDKQAIQRLSVGGFDKKQALVAYLVSNKNEKQATDYLVNNKNSNDSNNAKATKTLAIGQLISDNSFLKQGLNDFIAQKDPVLAQQIKENPTLFETALQDAGATKDIVQPKETTDWKAEYEKMKIEVVSYQTKYSTLVNEHNAIQANLRSVKANYDALLASSQNTTSSATKAFDTSLNTYRIRATAAYTYGFDIHHASWPDWLGYSVGEILNTNGVSITTRWGNLYRVRNSEGRIGVAYASNFTWA